MLKCMNKQCSNYKQELEDGTETCPACGEKTTNVISKVNNKLASVTAIISVAFIVAPFLLANFVGLGGIWAGFAVGAVCIGLAIYSKSIPVVIISVVSLLASIGLLFFFLQ